MSRYDETPLRPRPRSRARAISRRRSSVAETSTIQSTIADQHDELAHQYADGGAGLAALVAHLLGQQVHVGIHQQPVLSLPRVEGSVVQRLHLRPDLHQCVDVDLFEVQRPGR